MCEASQSVRERGIITGWLTDSLLRRLRGYDPCIWSFVKGFPKSWKVFWIVKGFPFPRYVLEFNKLFLIMIMIWAWNFFFSWHFYDDKGRFFLDIFRHFSIIRRKKQSMGICLRPTLPYGRFPYFCFLFFLILPLEMFIFFQLS